MIPPGTIHAFRNDPDRPARLLIIVVPRGCEGCFDGARELQSPMEYAERWQQVNERWDTHLIGPLLTNEGWQ